MARTVGVQFSIGASLQRTVASSFGTMASRVKDLRSDLSGLEKQSKRAATVTTTRGEWLSARSNYRAAPTAEARTALDQAARAYKTAAKSARAYGVDVRTAATQHVQLREQIARTEGAIARQHQFKANQNVRSELHGQILGTVASAMTVAVPIKLAIDYESAMADVKKVTKFDDAGFKAFSNDMLSLSETIPMSATGLAEIASAAGQAGIKESELLQFTTDAAKMGIAFDISAKEAGSAMTGLRTNFKLSQKDVVLLGDSFNALSNSMDAKASDIVKFASEVGGTASIYKFTGQEVGALAATFKAVRVGTEEASTATTAMLTRLGTADKLPKDAQKAFKALGMTGKEMAGMFRKDAQASLLLFLRRVKESKDPMRELTAIFGVDHAPKIAKLMNSVDLYENALVTASDTSSYAGSMEEEYAKRSETTANAMQLAANKVNRLGITIGSVALPAIVSILETVGPYITAMSQFAETHQTATTVVFGAIAALAALKVTTLAVRYGVTGVSDAWNVGKGAVNFFRRAVSRSGSALDRHGNAASRSAGATQGVVAPLRASSGAFTAQARSARTAAGALRTVGSAWKIALGPIGIVLKGLELLYNSFDWVKQGVDAFIEVIAEIPVVGPILKAIAGAAGFGAETEEEEVEAKARGKEALTKVNNALRTDNGNLGGIYSQGIPSVVAPMQSTGASQNVKVPQVRAVSPQTESKGRGLSDTWAFGAALQSESMAGFDLYASGFPTVTSPSVAFVPQTTPPAEPVAPSLRPVMPPTTTKTPPLRTRVSAPPEALPRTSAPPASERQLRGSQTQQPGIAPAVQLTQTFTLNGISDGDFARRVVEAMQSSKGEFERLLSSIVDDQRRLAYGR